MCSKHLIAKALWRQQQPEGRHATVEGWIGFLGVYRGEVRCGITVAPGDGAGDDAGKLVLDGRAPVSEQEALCVTPSIQSLINHWAFEQV